MANEQNLIPNSQRTPEELREQTRKGGIASGKKRREQKTFKELFNQVLNGQLQHKELKERMIEFGIPEGECTNKMALMFSMLNQGIKGNTKAFEIIRDTSGEQLTQKIEQVNPPTIKIERPQEHE